MAEAKKEGPGPMQDVIFVVGILIALAILWFYNNGPHKADLRGIFLHPPRPVEQGGAYGPTIGTTTINAAHY